MQRNLAMIAGLGISEHYKELEAQAAAKQKSKYSVLDWLSAVVGIEVKPWRKQVKHLHHLQGGSRGAKQASQIAERE